MKLSPKRSVLNGILGFLLFAVGILVLLLFVTIRSQADTANTSATIQNATPTVSGITISTSSWGGPALADATFTPRENTTTTVYVYGTFNDGNGCDEVTNGGELSVALSRTGIATSSCNTSLHANLYNCYVVWLNSSNTQYIGNGASCETSGCDGGNDTEANFMCTVPIQHFADATDVGAYAAEAWRAVVTSYDNSEASSSQAGTQFEIATLNAIDSGASVAYGALALGDTSPSDITLTITNTGNKDGADVELSGTAMTCTDGTIAVGQQKYATTTGSTYLSKSALTGSENSTGMLIKKQMATDTLATSNTYWMIAIPSSGLSGTCSGTITVIAA